MIEKPKLVNTNQESGHVITLHPDIIDILFEHRRHVKNTFLQIKGHYEIAYFGLNMINPSNELVSLSSMPHIEYNLIQQRLWQYDSLFSSKNIPKNTLVWWDELSPDNLFADAIKQIKLTSNHFSAGMTLCREINGFYFLYSYATQATQKNLQAYYASHIFGLIDVGDYFCNSLRDIYLEYCGHHALPQLNQLNSKAPDFRTRSVLKLIVNNT